MTFTQKNPNARTGADFQLTWPTASAVFRHSGGSRRTRQSSVRAVYSEANLEEVVLCVSDALLLWICRWCCAADWRINVESPPPVLCLIDSVFEKQVDMNLIRNACSWLCSLILHHHVLFISSCHFYTHLHFSDSCWRKEALWLRKSQKKKKSVPEVQKDESLSETPSSRGCCWLIPLDVLQQWRSKTLKDWYWTPLEGPGGCETTILHVQVSGSTVSSLTVVGSVWRVGNLQLKQDV